MAHEEHTVIRGSLTGLSFLLIAPLKVATQLRPPEAWDFQMSDAGWLKTCGHCAWKNSCDP